MRDGQHAAWPGHARALFVEHSLDASLVLEGPAARAEENGDA